ncbi:hypothetical protein LPH50_02160 [Xylella taiwanensis]|uniref:Uncharacterized protein n=1 Tax=Xylella taiwanensis TaxID=1444770 RepID=Z9JGD5_9GAMM|nr:hypothetical protein [Xylella taiwanensis]EWS77455.1 hypothetical protein AF72_10935 [Xylella taiwanensis]MCD8457044.1 hypothetical protein [Xylella taiwanensis]MCD8459454.1 hypothetical protein [Xylella taiwanensis]MCD8461677.1 hypothetical protein [Xylella taiwanensis]MCD8462295.1 hypothetical protein [Xylella taiwanensis]
MCKGGLVTVVAAADDVFIVVYVLQLGAFCGEMIADSAWWRAWMQR